MILELALALSTPVMLSSLLSNQLERETYYSQSTVTVLNMYTTSIYWKVERELAVRIVGGFGCLVGEK